MTFLNEAGLTQRPQSSSFLGLPYRILYMNPPKGTTMGPLGNALDFALPHRLNFFSTHIKSYGSLENFHTSEFGAFISIVHSTFVPL